MAPPVVSGQPYSWTAIICTVCMVIITIAVTHIAWGIF